MVKNTLLENNVANHDAIRVIETFCNQYEINSVTNKIWLLYNMAIENSAGNFSGEELEVFAVFRERLNQLVAASYVISGMIAADREIEHND